MSKKWIFFSLVISLAFSNGLRVYVDKVGVDRVDSPVLFSLYSIVVALFVNIVYWIIRYNSEVKALKRINLRYIGLLVCLGFILSGISLYFRFVGLGEGASATFTALSQVIITSFTAIWAYFILKEKLSRFFYLLFIFMLISSYLFVIGEFSIQRPTIGDLFIIVSAVSISFANILSKFLSGRLTTAQINIGRFLFGIPIYMALISFAGDLGFSLDPSYLFGALSGVVSGITVIFLYESLKRGSVTLVTTIMMISPLFTSVFSYFDPTIRERLNIIQIFSGLFLMLIGFLIVRFKGRGQ